MADIDRILCIRMVKRPPKLIKLGTPFDVTICITDDVGELMPYSDISRACELIQASYRSV